MARKPKKGIDYYPFDVNFIQNIKVKRILRACGSNSVAVLISLLGNIYGDEGYFMIWDDEVCFLIADEIGVKEVSVQEVVSKALQVGFFDNDIFDKYKILTSKGIQERYLEATLRRKNNSIDSKINLINVDINGINVYKNGVNVNNNGINVYKSTQSKVKESKVNNNISPELSEIINLYQDSGFGAINNTVRDSIIAMLEDFEINWIRDAFKVAAEYNAHSLKYVNSVLENWRRNGKDSTKPKTKRTKLHNFEQATDSMSEQDLEDIAKRKREQALKELGL